MRTVTIEIKATIEVPDSVTDAQVKEVVKFETGIIGGVNMDGFEDWGFQDAMNYSKDAYVYISK